MDLGDGAVVDQVGDLLDADPGVGYPLAPDLVHVGVPAAEQCGESDADRPESPQSLAPAGPGKLSARERELVTLVARGRTDADIAGELCISIRTVRSHLDRIRDKTGCRRRADLTRLALAAGLI